MSALHYLSATEALRRFEARALSPVELLEALLARIEAVEGQVRGYVRLFEERARQQAREAEARYASGQARPLEGLALAVKDLHPIAGEITTHGSLLLRDNVDETTLPTVSRLLEAGAILLGRTSTPEFGSATVTRSRLWGVTYNPWNLQYSPGGSSGGAGATLAAGTTTLADGSDYGGSIRIPASCCGLVGYKPPHGRNPGDLTVSLDPCSHFGPLGRCVSDVALMQNVMSGPSELDLASLPERVTLPTQDPGHALRGWKVAFSMDLGYVQVDPEVQAATLQVLDALRDLGCEIEPVELGWTPEVERAYGAWYSAADAAAGLPLLACRDQLCDYVLEEIERGRTVTAQELFAFQSMRAEMYRTLGPTLARCELFVCPTTAVPALPAEGEIRRDWVLTYPFNMLSALPVLSFPSGRARSGVPMGVQLVARPHDDHRVFLAAYALERVMGRWFTEPSHTPQL